MAPVPAWTEREWRPLALELVERLAARPSRGQDAAAAAGEVSGSGDAQEWQEALLLGADRVVGRLYMSGFLESTRPQVLSQARGLATKFRVHSLDERAERLERLAARCDFQVLKLLLELAVRPTAVSDTRIEVDPVEEGRSEYFMRLAEIKAEEEEGAAKERELRDQLIDEMVEISTNDDWYQEWDGTSDEDEDMDSVASDDIGKPAPWPVESSFAQMRRPKRTSAALEDDADALVDDNVDDLPLGQPGRASRQDYLVTENFELVDTSSDQVCSQDDTGRHQGIISVDLGLQEFEHSRFTMDRPWLLCPAVVADSLKRSHQVGASPIITLIHEETCVNLVFRALQGIASDFFVKQPSERECHIFNQRFFSSEFLLAPLAHRASVSHLSPTTFKTILQQFASIATSLQLLRDYQEKLRQLSWGTFSCAALDGLSSAQSDVLALIDSTILEVEQECYHTNNGASPDDCSESWLSYNASQTQSSLLGIQIRLKATFRIISWLSRILQPCLEVYHEKEFSANLQPSECSSWLLTSLYRQLDAELLEETQDDMVAGLDLNDEDSVSVWNWSRCDILRHLLVGALSPYIDLLHKLLFEQRGWSFSEISELPAELFFVNSSQSLVVEDQSFRAGLTQLMPLDIDTKLVPEFLKPHIELMRTAISSRQLLNHFLSMDYKAEEPPHELNLPPRSLREYITEGLANPSTHSIDDMKHKATGAMLLQDRRRQKNLGIESVSAAQLLYDCLGAPLEQKCRGLNSAIARIFRGQLQYLEYIETLRLFVLMQQQDVFGIFSKQIVSQIVRDPVGWTNSERINTTFQSIIHQMADGNMVSSPLRQIAERIHIRINSKELSSQLLSRKIDIGSMKCLYFTLSPPQPLRVLFSSRIMQKYSRISVFLLQAKAVESTLIQFKRGIRYRKSYTRVEHNLRAPLLQLADMLHYTKSLLAYLTDQIVSEEWEKCRAVVESSNDLAEMDTAHDHYLDQLLNRYFLLDKHATVTQYILSTFNQIMRYVGLLDDCVTVSDRFLVVESVQDAENLSTKGSTGRVHSMFTLPGNLERCDDLEKCSGEFRRQSHFLVVMLTAMAKHTGNASTHVGEILTRLNYNYFYHDQPQDRGGGYSAARPLPAPTLMHSRQQVLSRQRP